MHSASRFIHIKWRLIKRRLSLEQNWLVFQHGFTILELICTLALIAILSAIAIPKFMDFQDRSSDLTIKKAVNQLNVQVRVLFKKNRLDEESTNSYHGYTGDLGPDVIVTGQAPNTPLSGTIRLVSDSKTYEIIWIPGAKDDTKSPGHFKLGQKL